MKRSKHLKESSFQNNLIFKNETAVKRRRVSGFYKKKATIYIHWNAACPIFLKFKTVFEESSSCSSSSQETSEKTRTPSSPGDRATRSQTGQKPQRKILPKIQVLSQSRRALTEEMTYTFLHFCLVMVGKHIYFRITSGSQGSGWSPQIRLAPVLVCMHK